MDLFGKLKSRNAGEEKNVPPVFDMNAEKAKSARIDQLTGAQGLENRKQAEKILGQSGKAIDGRTARHKGDRVQFNMRIDPAIKNLAVQRAQAQNMAIGEFIAKLILDNEDNQ